jgi:hypothetical protein
MKSQKSTGSKLTLRVAGEHESPAKESITGGGGGAVKVVCRFRPLNDRERSESG